MEASPTKEDLPRTTTPPPSNKKRSHYDRSPSEYKDQRNRAKPNTPRSSPDRNPLALVLYNPPSQPMEVDPNQTNMNETRFTFASDGISCNDNAAPSQTQLDITQPAQVSDSPSPGQPSKETPPGDNAGAPNLGEHDEAPLPVPAGGFPRLEGISQTDAFSMIQQSKIPHWNNAADNKVLVFAAYDEVTNSTLDRRTRFEIYISKALRTTDKPKMLIPSPAFTPGRNRWIFPYLVYNLSHANATTLVEKYCWAFQEFTFFAIPYTIPDPSLALILMDVPLELSEEAYDEVKQCVVSCLRANPTFTHFVNQACKGGFELTVKVDGIYQTPTSRRNNNQAPLARVPAYRIYITPPTLSPSDFKIWQDIILNTRYDSATVSGNAHKPESLFCVLCKSLGHRKTSCPYPNIIGWPTSHPFNKEAQENNASAPAPSNTVGRGRGRTPRGRRGGFSA